VFRVVSFPRANVTLITAKVSRRVHVSGTFGCFGRRSIQYGSMSAPRSAEAFSKLSQSPPLRFHNLPCPTTRLVPNSPPTNTVMSAINGEFLIDEGLSYSTRRFVIRSRLASAHGSIAEISTMRNTLNYFQRFSFTLAAA